MSVVLQFLLLFAASACHLVLGELIWRYVSRLFKVELDRFVKDNAQRRAQKYVLGLLFHLNAILLLKIIGLPWLFAVLLPLCLVTLSIGSFRELLSIARGTPSLNFVVWTVVVLTLGVSIFDPIKGVHTAWRANFGDLAFHLGVISYFTFGDVFPPDYHLYPGVKLSYPFLMNLWTAGFWTFTPSLPSLKLIFVAQWVLPWTALYFLLRGDSRALLPWAILFGGGAWSYLNLLSTGSVPADTFSNHYISEGFPWTPFVFTVWVTQRTAVLGLICVASACGLFINYLADTADPKEKKLLLALSGFTLALSVLAHTHFFLLTVLFIGLNLAFRWSKDTIVFGISLLPALLVYPILSEKSSIVQFSIGWMIGKDADVGVLVKLWKIFWMWGQNAPIWILFCIVAWTLTKRHRLWLSILLLFLMANFTQLAIWEWDQIKVFIAIYVLSLCVAFLSDDAPKNILQLLALLLMIPAAVEVGRVSYLLPRYEIYSRKDVSRAEAIREKVPSDAVFLASAKHDSVITLTGRKLYLGYDGTLFSHGISYQERKKRFNKLKDALNCRTEVEDGERENCPTHLFWTNDERRFWKRRVPPAPAIGAGLPYLYRIDN